MDVNITLADVVQEKKEKIVTKLAVSVSREIETKVAELEKYLAAEKKKFDDLADQVSRRQTAMAVLNQDLDIAFRATNIDAVKDIRSKIETAGFTEEELAARRSGYPLYYMNRAGMVKHIG